MNLEDHCGWKRVVTIAIRLQKSCPVEDLGNRPPTRILRLPRIDQGLRLPYQEALKDMGEGQMDSGTLLRWALFLLHPLLCLVWGAIERRMSHHSLHSSINLLCCQN